jgi:ribosomal protein S18 acetylase RimI-like enzyme
MLEIAQAETPDDLDAVRGLMRAFVAWHRERHVEDRALIERYFDAAGFKVELAGLPGLYAPPRGRLLLARIDGEAAGCVALRDLGDHFCEMKRMFLPTEFRGRGVGRALGEAAMREARQAGYRAMRLDTSRQQAEAIALYQKLGFRRIASYYKLPADMLDWLIFMEAEL